LDDREKLNAFRAKEDWNRAIELNSRLLKNEPDNHWLITRLSSSYYEARQYRKALFLAKKALSIDPYCPLALWDYATSLDMLERESEAILIWKKLLKRGAERVAYGDCGEGIRWAESLMNDCRYRIGRSYVRMGKISTGKKYYKMHLNHRKAGLPSLYSRREVEAQLRKL